MAMSKSIGFTGTQKQPDEFAKKLLYRTLEDLVHAGFTELHHGDCIGADRVAHITAVSVGGLRVIVHPPTVESKRAFCTGDEILPTKSYMARNQAIVDAADLLVAMPLTATERHRSGTWSTVRRARKAGIPVLYIVARGKTGERISFEKGVHHGSYNLLV